MVVIGVTGGFGTGKSTVAKMLKAKGAVVLDADHLAHKVMEPKQLAWRRIVKRFGAQILHEDHTINRKRLSEIVFHDPQQRKHLEAIIHPQVIRAVKRELHRLHRIKTATVVLDVPLLIEAGLQSLVDVLVVVAAPDEVAQKRLQAKGWSEPDIQARRLAQWDLSAKQALADVVINNTHSVEDTRRQVNRLWNTQVAQRSRK